MLLVGLLGRDGNETSLGAVEDIGDRFPTGKRIREPIIVVLECFELGVSCISLSSSKNIRLVRRP